MDQNQPSRVKQPFLVILSSLEGLPTPKSRRSHREIVFVLSLKLLCRSESPEQQNGIATEN